MLTNEQFNSSVSENVTITSFALRSLRATISCDYDLGAPDFSNKEKKIEAVMKDGSSGGSVGEQQFLAESPILLDNVDHILLSDGTKLPMP